MLPVALSVFHLFVVNGLAYAKKAASVLFTIFNMCWVCMVVCIGLGGNLLVSQTILICILWLLCFFGKPRRKLFTIGSLIGTALNYVIFTVLYYNREEDFEQLKQKFPLESLEGRLPERDYSPSEPLSDKLDSELKFMEEEFGWSGYHTSYRSYHLKRLHQNEVNDFADRSGFGVGRMENYYGKTTEAKLKGRQPEREFLPQPASPFQPASLFDFAQLKDVIPNDKNRNYHRGGLADFANLHDFGYVAGKKQAAGFVPHRFTKMPKEESFQLQRVELMGLLRHDKPVVYMTENLPSMTEAVKAPTRNLDEFEANALARLRTGDDLIVAEGPGGLRMVGSIRLAKQCADCHSGQRGDLLGAFTYVLKPAK